MTRTEWINARALELNKETGLLLYKCYTLAACEWNARFARLTVVEGGKD